jgi:mRNA interferase RelE/StbE
MSYRIEFSPRAFKQFKTLPKRVQKGLKNRIDSLSDDPRPKISKKLEGANNLYRLRFGDYRAVYRIEDNILLVLVVKIGHQEDIYRMLME